MVWWSAAKACLSTIAIARCKTVATWAPATDCSGQYRGRKGSAICTHRQQKLRPTTIEHAPAPLAGLKQDTLRQILVRFTRDGYGR